VSEVEPGERALLRTLTQRGLLSPAQALETERDAAAWRAGLADTLLARRLVAPEVLAGAIADATGLQLLDERALPLDVGFAQERDLDFFVRHQVLPWRREGDRAIIAVINPFTAEPVLAHELQGEPFTMRIVTKSMLIGALHAGQGERVVSSAIGDLAAAHPELSAKSGLSFAQFIVFSLLGGGLIWAFNLSPEISRLVASRVAGGFFIFAMLFRLILTLASVAPSGFARRDKSAPGADEMPPYSILVALYDEATLVAETARAIGRIDYPWTKLDIIFILEESDAKTRAACAALPLDGRFTIVTVPDRRPRTKPKACNFGLAFARGEYVALYDAEDRPDPQQLLRSVESFCRIGPEVSCLQARLNFYNAGENWLTSQFALEFAVWFQFILPGLERLGLPIPLGGTSNHFRRAALVSVGGWDAYNVTEDADIGMRLARLGHRTRTLASTTAEEANCALPNWIHQRSRWLKGYMQTYLVHMRRPGQLWRDFGPAGFLSFQVLIGGAVLSPVLHLVFWSMFAVEIARAFPWIGFDLAHLFTRWDFLVLLIGNGAAILTGFIAALGSDCRGGGRASLAFNALAMPLYWFLISAGALKGFFSYFSRPFYWAKTRHGISRIAPIDFASDQFAPRRIITRAKSGQA
jgi:cellulose synthase/poly-beta-1,6-N-acetylglucosamine synthase-like glycosyltransferase